jgi:transposase-like protein
VPEVAMKYGLREQTLYAWRKRYGDMAESSPNRKR